MSELTVIPTSGVDTYRLSTDAASISKAIVLKTALEIQGRKYVRVEGWQAIAVAHGCTASSGDVQRVEGGFKATGQIRRMDTGAIIAEAEGFVGEDEAVWFGGEGLAYGKPKTFPKRPDYAIRAMAQTRAISRACRSAFAHVVVMMDAGLQTTPAEEVPAGGFPDQHSAGPAGAAGRALDETARDIAQQNGGETRSTYQIAKDNKLAKPKITPKEWADSAIQILNTCATLDSVNTWWRTNDAALQALQEKAEEQYERVATCADDARASLKAHL